MDAPNSPHTQGYLPLDQLDVKSLLTSDPTIEFPVRRSKLVEFLHPSYVYPDNLLFRLPALDNPVENHTISDLNSFMIWHDIALQACEIIAGNRSGYLTEEITSPPIPSSCIFLSARKYYFHLSQSNDNTTSVDINYSIVTTFREWTFPYARVPGIWAFPQDQLSDSTLLLDVDNKSSKMSDNVERRDRCCLVTQMPREVCDNTHIVPAAEVGWFLKNRMDLYNEVDPSSATGAINDFGNGVMLEKGIHHLFDSGDLVFVPHGSDYCCYFLGIAHPEMTGILHNRKIKIHKQIRSHYLYARFAYKLFKDRIHAASLRHLQTVSVSVSTSKTIAENEGPSSWTESSKASQKPTEAVKRQKDPIPLTILKLMISKPLISKPMLSKSTIPKLTLSTPPISKKR